MAAITLRGADDLAAAGHVTNGCTRGGHRVWDDGWVRGAARVIRVVTPKNRRLHQEVAGEA